MPFKTQATVVVRVWVVHYLTGYKLKVVWAEFSTLGLAV